MTYEEERRQKLGSVIGKGLDGEEAVRLELLAAAQETGDWHLISSELHGLLSLYAMNKVSDKSVEIYSALLNAPSSEHINFSIAARDLYSLELYDAALDAVRRGTANLSQDLLTGKYPIAQNIPFFFQYFSLEIAILSEMDPTSPRIPELKASLSFAVTQRRMNVDYLYTMVTKLAPKGVDRSLKNIVHGLIADLELHRSILQEDSALSQVELDQIITRIEHLSAFLNC
ncbi:MAG: hypothetical protein JWN14_4765 [Chthonomonadales bacterium]|nr:hypothetical protein [Chthonomonadales bacterium]